MSYFVTNRDIIKNLGVNTGTSSSPVYTTICTTSELSLNEDFEQKDFYVYCDAIQRSIITGASMSIEGTLKLDVENTGVTKILGDIHTLLSSGTVSQFNNLMIQFDLLTGVSSNVLTYTTYTAEVALKTEGLGGAAEDEGELSFTMTLNGNATASA